MGKCCSKMWFLICSEEKSEIGENWVRSQNGENDQLPDHVQHGFNVAVILVSILHLIVAVGIIIFGIYIYALRSEFSSSYGSIDDPFVRQLSLVPIYLLVIGCVVTAVSLIGIAGILRHHVPLMITYLAFLIVYTLAQIVCAILAVTLKDRIKDKLQDYFSNQAIGNYRNDVDLQNIIDYFQSSFKCCGASSSETPYRDWSRNEYFACHPLNPSFEKCGVPFSCCIGVDVTKEETISKLCGYDAQNSPEMIHTDNCIDSIFDWVLSYSGWIVLAICILIFIPIALEIMLAFLIKDVREECEGYEEFEKIKRENPNDPRVLALQRRIDAGEFHGGNE